MAGFSLKRVPKEIRLSVYAIGLYLTAGLILDNKSACAPDVLHRVDFRAGGAAAEAGTGTGTTCQVFEALMEPYSFAFGTGGLFLALPVFLFLLWFWYVFIMDFFPRGIVWIREKSRLMEESLPEKTKALLSLAVSLLVCAPGLYFVLFWLFVDAGVCSMQGGIGGGVDCGVLTSGFAPAHDAFGVMGIASYFPPLFFWVSVEVILYVGLFFTGLVYGINACVKLIDGLRDRK